MKYKLYKENRKELVESIEKGEAVILFSGHAPKKTADEKYPFAPNRNFLYMTGVVEENIILYLEKTESQIKETLFIHRYDELKA